MKGRPEVAQVTSRVALGAVQLRSSFSGVLRRSLAHFQECCGVQWRGGGLGVRPGDTNPALEGSGLG